MNVRAVLRYKLKSRIQSGVQWIRMMITFSGQQLLPAGPVCHLPDELVGHLLNSILGLKRYN